MIIDLGNTEEIVHWRVIVRENSGLGFELTSDVSSGSYFPSGDTTGTVTATDTFGNSAAVSFTIYVTGTIEGLTHKHNKC